MTIRKRLYYWWLRVTNRKDIINWVFELQFPYKIGDVMSANGSSPQLLIVYVKKLKDGTYKVKTLPLRYTNANNLADALSIDSEKLNTIVNHLKYTKE